MDENDKARAPDEQAAQARLLWELSYRHQRQDWPDPLRARYELARDELDVPHSQVPGHRWNAWRRLTSDEGYYASAESTCLPPQRDCARGQQAQAKVLGGRTCEVTSACLWSHCRRRVPSGRLVIINDSLDHIRGVRLRAGLRRFPRTGHRACGLSAVRPPGCGGEAGG